MKILIAAPRFPYPLDKGDRLTIFNYLKYFHSIGFKVTLAVFYEKNSELDNIDKIEGFCDKLIPVKLKRTTAVFNVLKNLFAKIPFQISYYQNSEYRKKINELIKKEKYDLLYAHTIRMAPYIKDIDMPKVCAMQISMALNYRRLKEKSNNIFKKFFYTIEWKLVKKYEYDITFKFDKCFLISKYDREEIEKSGDELKNIFYNPHGVDHVYFKPDLSIEKETNSLIMTGNFGYYPNADAILYFYNEIYPLVLNKIPDIKILVVGKNPPSELLNLKSDNFVVTGMVDDLRPYLNKACVGIDPLRIGAGLQNKVIEAMSMALPVVATSAANEGIMAKDGEEILIANSKEEYAEKIISILNSENKRKEISEKARTFILREYTWEYFLSELVDQFKIVIQSHNAA